jgi:hypothetical protein
MTTLSRLLFPSSLVRLLLLLCINLKNESRPFALDIDPCLARRLREEGSASGQVLCNQAHDGDHSDTACREGGGKVSEMFTFYDYDI